MSSLLYALLASTVAESDLHPLPDLAARILAETGQRALLDPRLAVARCPAPRVTPGAGFARLSCQAPAWNIYVPLTGVADASARSAPSAPTVRRGDQVTVAAEGSGYVVSLKAVADSDARDGRVWVKGNDGHRRLASIAADGRLVLPH